MVFRSSDAHVPLHGWGPTRYTGGAPPVRSLIFYGFLRIERGCVSLSPYAVEIHMFTFAAGFRSTGIARNPDPVAWAEMAKTVGIIDIMYRYHLYLV